MERRILFVDDETHVLHGLRRMLRPLRHEWEMEFTERGTEALDFLSTHPCDVIVSDMRMPGMDGNELLLEVRKRHPEMLRIILSGYSDRETILKSVKSAHQYLAKPCDAETLRLTIERASRLRDILKNDSVKQVVAKIDSLPSLPTLYTDIMQEMQSENASVQVVGGIIAKDPGMSAKILQLVNSAFFGLPRHVTDPQQAVSLLGLDTVRSLVLMIGLFTQFNPSRESLPELTNIWNHSLMIGELAKRFARAERANRQVVEDAYLAGLLHDVGKLVLLDNFPTQYHEAQESAEREGTVLIEAERQLIGSNHADIGAYLLGLWSLPASIVETVACHHEPRRAAVPTLFPLAGVYVADQLINGNVGYSDLAHKREGSRIDYSFLKGVGAEEKLPGWQTVYEEVLQEG